MNSDTIITLLTNSGFYGVRMDADFVYMEDPSCILRGFETFLNYAWFAIVLITGVMLFGWAISMIRGAKNDMFSNMKNLILIFGVLCLTKPMMNLIYGGDLFAIGCETIAVPIEEMNKLLDARNSNLNPDNELSETLDIFDSGARFTSDKPHEIPYSQAPLSGAGDI